MVRIAQRRCVGRPLGERGEVSTTGSAPKIVIAADDNPHNLQLLEAVIQSQGYVFFGVPSGHKCLEMAERFRPSLFILDIEMPEMSGFETCRQLRLKEATRTVPVAFFTAHRRDADFREGIAAGGNDFLLKPIEPAKLIARIRRLIEGSSSAGAGADPRVLWL